MGNGNDNGSDASGASGASGASAASEKKKSSNSIKKPKIRPELLAPEYETFVKDNELPSTVVGLKINDTHWLKQIRNYIGERCRHWPPVHQVCCGGMFLSSGYYPDFVGTIGRNKVGMKFADAIVTGEDDGFEENAYKMLKKSRKSKSGKKSRKSMKHDDEMSDGSEGSRGSRKSTVVTEEVTETYVIKRKKNKDGEAQESMTDLLKNATPVKVDRQVSVGSNLISHTSKEEPNAPRKSMNRKSLGGRKSLRKQSVISLAGDDDDDDDDSDSDEDDDDDDVGELSRRKSRKSVGGRKSIAGRKSVGGGGRKSMK